MSKVRSDIGPFAIVPLWLLQAGVSARALHLFVVLDAKYADQDHQAWPARKTLAAQMGVKSVRTVDEALKELIAAGALTVERREADEGDSDTNLYQVIHVAPKGAELCTGGRSELHDPVQPAAPRGVQSAAGGGVQPVAPKPDPSEPDPSEPDQKGSPGADAPGAPVQGDAEKPPPEPAPIADADGPLVRGLLGWVAGPDGVDEALTALRRVCKAGRPKATGYRPLTPALVAGLIADFEKRGYAPREIFDKLVELAGTPAFNKREDMPRTAKNWLLKDFPERRTKGGGRAAPARSAGQARGWD